MRLLCFAVTHKKQSIPTGKEPPKCMKILKQNKINKLGMQFVARFKKKKIKLLQGPCLLPLYYQCFQLNHGSLAHKSFLCSIIALRLHRVAADVVGDGGGERR